MINDSYDYEASKRTSRLSAPSRSSSSSRQVSDLGGPRAVRRGSAVARSMFKGRVLKPLHLNAVKKEKEEANNNEDNEDKAGSEVNSGKKYRVQKAYACHHEDQYHGHHHPHGQDVQPQHAHRNVKNDMTLDSASIASDESLNRPDTRPPKHQQRAKMNKSPASTPTG